MQIDVIHILLSLNDVSQGRLTKQNIHKVNAVRLQIELICGTRVNERNREKMHKYT